jgi:hypothetical protein
MVERPEPPGGKVLSSLPSTRPQRRSSRREGAAAKAAKPGPAKAKAAAGARKRTRATAGGQKARAARPKAAGGRPTAVRPSAATKAASRQPRDRPPETPQGIELVGTAVQAAGELAQFGLQLGTKALAGAVRRIPRP